MKSMDDILADEPKLENLPEGPEEPKVAASETPAPVEAKKVDPKADDDSEEDVEQVDQSLDGLKRALAAARGDKRKARKRWQETEKQLAMVQGQLAALQQMGSRPPETTAAKVPDATDIETDFYGKPIEYLNKRDAALKAEIEAAKNEIRTEHVKNAANRSERNAKTKYQDYEEAKAAFMQVASQPENAWMWQPVFADPDVSAEVVYREGKRLLGGGASEVESQLQAKIAELEAKISEISGGNSQAPAKTIPPRSTAGARGSGIGSQREWSGPHSMDEILS